MASEFISNGDFRKKFRDWIYNAQFQVNGDDTSFRMPVSVIASQNLVQDIPGQTMRLKFDVLGLEPDGARITVTVGGLQPDGNTMVSIAPVMTTTQWREVLTRLAFEQPLTSCFISITTLHTPASVPQGAILVDNDLPPAAATPTQALPQADVLIRRISLTIEPVA